MTKTDKKVRRISCFPHRAHERRIIVTIGDGDVVGLRLERAPEAATCYVPLEHLYDYAELRRAKAQAGGGLDPCKNPKAVRNV